MREEAKFLLVAVITTLLGLITTSALIIWVISSQDNSALIVAAIIFIAFIFLGWRLLNLFGLLIRFSGVTQSPVARRALYLGFVVLTIIAILMVVQAFSVRQYFFALLLGTLILPLFALHDKAPLYLVIRSLTRKLMLLYQRTSYISTPYVHEIINNQAILFLYISLGLVGLLFVAYVLAFFQALSILPIRALQQIGHLTNQLQPVLILANVINAVFVIPTTLIGVENIWVDRKPSLPRQSDRSLEGATLESEEDKTQDSRYNQYLEGLRNGLDKEDWWSASAEALCGIAHVDADRAPSTCLELMRASAVHEERLRRLLTEMSATPGTALIFQHFLTKINEDFISQEANDKLNEISNNITIYNNYWDRIKDWAKRWVDIEASLIVLTLGSPLWITAFYLTQRRKSSIFTSTKRITRGGKFFNHYQLNTSPIFEARHREDNKEPITDHILERHYRRDPVTHFILRTSLWKLPELFNVLLGELSLAGRRPARLLEWELFYRFGEPEDWHRLLRHKPGLGGLSPRWDPHPRPATRPYEKVVQDEIRAFRVSPRSNPIEGIRGGLKYLRDRWWRRVRDREWFMKDLNSFVKVKRVWNDTHAPRND